MPIDQLYIIDGHAVTCLDGAAIIKEAVGRDDDVQLLYINRLASIGTIIQRYLLRQPLLLSCVAIILSRSNECGILRTANLATGETFLAKNIMDAVRHILLDSCTPAKYANRSVAGNILLCPSSFPEIGNDRHVLRSTLDVVLIGKTYCIGMIGERHSTEHTSVCIADIRHLGFRSCP